ncbi:lysylphosphatidylglycerol synthase transmembrane domain-containing protein [Actinoplanes ianthinogenes]|uniref:lysylphosphatidylglycerol synthase transmembrane domain-containing protein n=1 Tax=Actinoplanes ianthinogenes TaxID=122358 RepID=UPI00167069C5|nr:YbhN family protein [Actinoplanes ianthinogenes]
MSGTGRRRLRYLLIVLVAAVAIGTLRGRLPDPADFLGALRAADWWWALLAVAAGSLSQFAYAEQQRRLLAAFDVHVPSWRAVAMTYVRSALSLALPAGSAASAAYAFQTYRRHGATPAVSATATLLSAVVTVLSLVLLCSAAWSVPATLLTLLAATLLWLRLRSRRPAAPFLSPQPAVSGSPDVSPQAAASGLPDVSPQAAASGLPDVSPQPTASGPPDLSPRSIASGPPDLSPRSAVPGSPGRRRGAGRLRAAGRRVIAPAARLLRRPALTQALRDARAVPPVTWFAVLVASTVNWLLDMCCLVLAAAAVHVEIPWHRLALIYLAVQVVRQIPLTPGGIGLIETSMLAGLIAAGAPQVTAAAVVLIYRAVSFWLILPAGLAAHLALRRPTRMDALPDGVARFREP